LSKADFIGGAKPADLDSAHALGAQLAKAVKAE